jgi:pseudaminic acid synthase
MNKSIFFVAEISANHCGKLKVAKQLISCAKKNGADAVKLQTYTPDTMTLKSNKKYFKISEGLWKGQKLWDLYNKGRTPLEWHEELFKYGKKIGIKIFSTPFDETSVDFLEKLNCPIYKVASFEMTDLSLIKKISKTKKPIIISTGMASLIEIEQAYSTAKKNGAKDITLLYCVSNYPSKNSDFNLNNIKILKNKFNCKVGLSDHSKDNRIVISAIAAGAEVIEKHIALDNQKKGLDIEFSLKGKEIKRYREDIDLTFNLFKKSFFYRDKSELKSKIFRRSIFITKDIKKGEKFNEENIKKIRPGHGIEPKFYEKLLRKRSPSNLYFGEPMTYQVLRKLKVKY